MQMFIGGFAVFAFFCSTPPAFGSLIIDNFNTFLPRRVEALRLLLWC